MPQGIFAGVSQTDYEKCLLTSAQSSASGGCSAPDSEPPCILAPCGMEKTDLSTKDWADMTSFWS